MNSEEFARRLCSWQREKGRQNLPWFTSDPYRRWLSEIMLQQTQVSVVRDYFSRFLQAFPTVDDLAEASEEDVMRLWAGLGYYSRARNLHKAAKEIAAAGRFPQTRAAWEKLPGVGSSTAAALASFCNGEVAAVCDGNVKRVLARIFALSAPINQSKTAKLLQQRAEALVSRTDPGCYNQAMMDLGAMLCTRTTPKCEQCPVGEFCKASRQGNPLDYPVKAPAKPRRTALVHALLCVEIKEEEQTVDRLCSGINNYVIKLSSLSLNEKEHQHVASILQILSDIERVSDYCENISEFAETLTERKAVFTEIGTKEMREMIETCADSFKYAVEAFTENDKDKAMKVIEKESQADDLEIRLRTEHMKRLANNQCNTDAGIVYLDALVALERISDHSRNIAEEVLTASCP